MRCNNAKILISAHTDGELSEREKEALEEHLSSCPACREEQRAFAGLRETMALWTDEEPSPWLAQNFAHKLARLHEQVQSAGYPRLRWLVGTTAAGLAAGLLALGFLLTNQPQPPVDTTEPAPAISYSPTDRTKVPTEDSSSGAIKVGPAPEPGTQQTGVNVQPPAASQAPTPGPTPPLVVQTPTKVADEKRHFGPLRTPELGSRHSVPVTEAEREIVKKILVARLTESEASHAVSSNLGEAGLAMNQTVEIVRGTLRKAADVLALELSAGSPTPAEGAAPELTPADSEEGGTL